MAHQNLQLRSGGTKKKKKKKKAGLVLIVTRALSCGTMRQAPEGKHFLCPLRSGAVSHPGTVRLGGGWAEAGWRRCDALPALSDFPTGAVNAL
ncbi:hypothetical protein INR49_006624 [Caranx melampygus]|nr:hypothetical protein INR49_006624 [Caranx melampygus]